MTMIHFMTIAIQALVTQPGVQFYTGNMLSNVVGKDGTVYGKYAGFCVEPEFFPDTPNQPSFPDALFGPGKKYDEKAVYKFAYGSGGLGRGSTALDYQKVSDDTLNKYVSWDVTSAAKNWYNSTAKKGAMILVSQNEDSQPLWASFIGHLYYDDSPYFIVNYRNTVGLEDYYTYQTVSAGRGGTVHIGDYSNQITLVNNIASYNIHLLIHKTVSYKKSSIHRSDTL